VNEPLQRDDESGVVELRIPRQAEWVAVARLALSAVASRLRFSLEEIEDLKLAIAEACTSAIQHGESGTIDILCDARPDALQVTVRSGPGRPDDATRSREDDPIGELGIFIIRSLMDSVDYSVDPRTGTTLVMTKRVSA
jgi:serine/threonine-protein kinase RsbW